MLSGSCAPSIKVASSFVQNNRNIVLKPSGLFIIFFLCVFALPTLAQRPVDTPQLPVQDTLPAVDTTLSTPPGSYKVSNSGLEAPVVYPARDSTIFDNLGKKIRMYGQAKVTYEEISLEANYIEVDYENQIILASGYPDSSGTMAGFPVFKDGEQEFKAEKIRYNYDTEKGIVYDVTTQQEDIIVHGGMTKFIRGDSRDTTSNDILYSSDALFTTCTLDEPHFGIHSNKQKVVPNKLVIVGPSNLEIMGAPTPVWLPFGFFPITSGRRSGLLFPNDFEYSQTWGFGLRGVGWFFPLSDNFNLELRSDIYLKGTFGLSAASTYRKRYKYNGNIRVGFDSRQIENPSDASISRNQSFSIQWSHRQDSRAHPTNSFGGNINIQTNNYQSRVFNNAQNVLQTQLTSNMTFTKRWQDAPLTFSAAFNHSQNTNNRQVTINFPDLRFQTQTFYPFKRKGTGGNQERWYETINMRYSAEAKNRLTATDTTLFDASTLENAQTGMRQDISMGSTFKVLQYFNISPNVSYQEVWNLRSLDRTFDPTLQIVADTLFNPDDPSDFVVEFDTISFGQINTDTLRGFRSWRRYSAGLSLNTRIFGTLNFRKGFLRGLRHEIRPTISLSYSPNYLDPDLGYYQELQSDVRFPDQTQTFSVFQGAIFGAPPRSGQQFSLNYSLNNIFQAKVYSKRDSTSKKVKLIDNLFISGNYNFAADTLNWSPVSVRTTARFFKGITTLGFNATFDPYILNESGRRINELSINNGGGVLRFDRASLRATSNITVSKLRSIFQGKEEEVVTDVSERQRQRRLNPNREEQDFLSLFENFSISHNISFDWVRRDEKTEFMVSTNSINCRGQIQLTKNWAISVGNFGYDFVRNGLSYPSVGFRRDLHCWEMDMQWQPTRGTYTFNIRVKPGTLDFIKVPYQRNNIDGRNAFR